MAEVLETRDKAENALAQLVLIQQSASVGYWLLDLESGSVLWSDAVYRILCKDPKTFQPDLQPDLEFCHLDDRDSVRKEVERGTNEAGSSTSNGDL